MKNIMLKTFQIVLIGLLLFTSPAILQAAKKSNDQLAQEISALQQGAKKIEQDMTKLRRLLDNRAMLELFQRMDELADEVSQLHGLLEQQNHDLAGLKKRQRDLYLDTDRRLRELEITSTGSQTEQPAVLAPAANTTSGETPAVPDAGNQALPTKTPPAVVKPAVISTPKKNAVPMSEERAAYQKSFDMLKEGRYAKANTSFREFLARFPTSSYAGNAQYWLGESNYVTRQFEQAVTEFEAVLAKYPTSNKVPDAMLKLGYTYYELRQFDNAKTILQRLRKAYGKGTAARLAGKRLDRMKKEGH